MGRRPKLAYFGCFGICFQAHHAGQVIKLTKSATAVKPVYPVYQIKLIYLTSLPSALPSTILKPKAEKWRMQSSPQHPLRCRLAIRPFHQSPSFSRSGSSPSCLKRPFLPRTPDSSHVLLMPGWISVSVFDDPSARGSNRWRGWPLVLAIEPSSPVPQLKQPPRLLRVGAACGRV
jgi:hypothetical protein